MQTFHLRLFGTPTLELGDVALTGRAVQRHRLALLALLAIAPGRRMSRDKLMTYLWPDRDADRGRNLLKQATYVLRAELGENALLSEGDDLRLNEQVVNADAVAFDVASKQRDFRRAAELYRGPFMDGFFLGDAPEFEEWMAQERRRFGDAYGHALEQPAAAAEVNNDWHEAEAWWRQRAAHDPYDTRVALRLMHVLDRNGSRAAALQHAALHQRLLQEEFGIDAPPELLAAVEQLRQPRAEDVHEHVQEDEHVHAHRHGYVPNAAGSRKRSWLRVALPGSALLLLAAIIWAAVPRATDPKPSIVVLPFQNLTGDADQEFFSDGLTEEVIARLSALPQLKVISRTSAMHYKETRKPLREVARELNVAHVLEGSVRLVDGRVRVTAQLIDAATDNHLWADNYELELHNALRVQEQIANAVARELALKIGKQAAGQLARRGTDDPEAHRLYQRGRWLWTQRTRAGILQSIAYFEQAIARDSTYSDAYAGLADAYIVAYQSGVIQDEDSARLLNQWAAERALALDDASTEAHAAGGVALVWQSNWAGAEREYKRALALNPGNANARSLYAMLLYGMGRLEESREHARRAFESDPYAIIVSIIYAYSNYLLEDYDAALEQYRRTLEIRSDWVPAMTQSALVYAQQGRHPEALALATKAVQQTPNYPASLADAAYVYARAGNTAEARTLLQRAKTNNWDAFHIARAHVALAESDSAFVWLERTRWKWPHRGQLADPALDPIRSDPRFRDLAERVQRSLGIRLSRGVSSD